RADARAGLAWRRAGRRHPGRRAGPRGPRRRTRHRAPGAAGRGRRPGSPLTPAGGIGNRRCRDLRHGRVPPPPRNLRDHRGLRAYIPGMPTRRERTMRGRLADLFNLRRGEAGPVLVAALFFFCVLTALMLLRPARDALGMSRGIESVRWLFIGTALATLLVNPAFGWLVSRFRRLQFIAATYAFFALGLCGFWALLQFAPEAVGERSGQVFYVWFSVFNLFSTMVFWALMADRFA